MVINHTLAPDRLYDVLIISVNQPRANSLPGRSPVNDVVARKIAQADIEDRVIVTTIDTNIYVWCNSDTPAAKLAGQLIHACINFTYTEMRPNEVNEVQA